MLELLLDDVSSACVLLVLELDSLDVLRPTVELLDSLDVLWPTVDALLVLRPTVLLLDDVDTSRTAVLELLLLDEPRTTLELDSPPLVLDCEVVSPTVELLELELLLLLELLDVDRLTVDELLELLLLCVAGGYSTIGTVSA